MKDIPKAIIVLVAVGILLTLAHHCARAGEWFPEASVFVDITNDDGLYCHDHNNEASHLGARVDLWASGPHRFRALWLHASCVQEEDDLRDRNVFGIGYEFRLW